MKRTSLAVSCQLNVIDAFDYSLLVCFPRHYSSNDLSQSERRDGSGLCEIKDPT